MYSRLREAILFEFRNIIFPIFRIYTTENRKKLFFKQRAISKLFLLKSLSKKEEILFNNRKSKKYTTKNYFDCITTKKKSEPIRKFFPFYCER